MPQPTFSAALVAYIEAHHDDTELKNQLCATVPRTDAVEQFPRTVLASMANEERWRKYPELRDWIRRSRLDGFAKVVAAVSEGDVEKQKILAKMREKVRPAVANLRKLAARYPD
jgi:hypothetical protein